MDKITHEMRLAQWASIIRELPAPVTNDQQNNQPDAVLRIGNYALDIYSSIFPMLLQTIMQVMAHSK